MAVTRTILPRKGFVQPQHGLTQYESDMDANLALLDANVAFTADVPPAPAQGLFSAMPKLALGQIYVATDTRAVLLGVPGFGPGYVQIATLPGQWFLSVDEDYCLNTVMPAQPAAVQPVRYLPDASEK